MCAWVFSACLANGSSSEEKTKLRVPVTLTVMPIDVVDNSGTSPPTIPGFWLLHPLFFLLGCPSVIIHRNMYFEVQLVAKEWGWSSVN